MVYVVFTFIGFRIIYNYPNISVMIISVTATEKPTYGFLLNGERKWGVILPIVHNDPLCDANPRRS